MEANPIVSSVIVKSSSLSLEDIVTAASLGNESDAEKVLNGKVVAVQVQEGKQILTLQVPQGRIQVQAEGDFQKGDAIRLQFAGTGLTLEKVMISSLELTSSLPIDLNADLEQLQNLRNVLIENLVKASMNKADESNNESNTQLLSRNGLAKLDQISLSSLIQQTLAQSSGSDFLEKILLPLGQVKQELFHALWRNLTTVDIDPTLKQSLWAWIKKVKGDDALLMANTHDFNLQGLKISEVSAASTENTIAPKLGELYKPQGKMEETKIWFGKIIERESLASQILPEPLKQAAWRGNNVPADPLLQNLLYRYKIDLGGAQIATVTSQVKASGEFAYFHLMQSENQWVANFEPLESAIPVALKAMMHEEHITYTPALQVAYDHLQDYKAEPYFNKLLIDFSKLLQQSTILENPNKIPLPSPKELDGLLKILVAFPREEIESKQQALQWGKMNQQPEEAINLVKPFLPETEQVVVHKGLPLHKHEAPSVLLSTVVKALAIPQAVWEKIPSQLALADLPQILRESLNKVDGPINPEQKFLLQAAITLFPKEENQTGTQTLYFWQNPMLHPFQIEREKNKEKSEAESSKKNQRQKKPEQFQVETETPNMGLVSVHLQEHEKGYTLSFKNQFHDVRDLLQVFLPELEKALAPLDFRIQSWQYGKIENTKALPNIIGNSSNASAPSQSMLDLFG